MRDLIPILGCLAAAALAAGTPGRADPLSKKADVDFFREVPSRNLRGLATRSDGRIVAGPAFTELKGAVTAEMLWCLEPAPGGRWLVGSGPEGRILEITPDAAKGSFAVREAGRLDDSQVFALRRLPDGSVLAGTSPRGQIALLRDGKVAASALLPADSVLDILLPPGAGGSALVATGNPGRIYRVDLAAFSAGGISTAKGDDTRALAAHGIVLFGEIRDRNVRRLAAFADGRIAAGSAPRGNVYAFPAAGGAPVILQENRDAEVTALLPQPDGSLLASLVFSTRPSSMLARLAAAEKPPENPAGLPPPAQPEKFEGRGALVRFPADGFPETLLTRIGTAFYGLARLGDIVLVSGGEKGDLTGYDLSQRLALTFGGSTSARLTALAPLPGEAGRFLVLRNNAPGLALLDFGAASPREAETQQIDLGVPARFGALRFNRLRDIAGGAVSLDIRASNGSDDLEGWSAWMPMKETDGGWSAGALRGRYLKLRLRVAADAPKTLEADKASFFYLPQDRRPLLEEFHFVSPNFALIRAPDPLPPAMTTLSQLLQAKEDEKRKTGFLSSQVVPQQGAQIAFWTVSDPDGDEVACTFSIRRDGDAAWTDLAIDTRESYVQFDTSHLADGVYFTRLTAKEAAPRPEADRLSVSFGTDNLVIDHSPPDILDATVRRAGPRLVVTVHGRDALSLLTGIELQFNNGVHEAVEQPVDGIRDGREESFSLEEPLDALTGATSVEVTLYDAAGNAASRRLPLTPR